MARRTPTALAGAALVAFASLVTTAASAADTTLSPRPDGASFAPATGWYARADVGYRFTQAGAVSAPDPASSGRIDDGAGVGAGFGFKAGWFRADMTFDYGPAVNYAATLSPAGTLASRIDSVAVLLNGYVDLGTWGGFTPYVGAGVGGAMLTTTGFSYLPAHPAGTIATNSKWNLAWAVAGGVGWAVSRDLLVDVGYRYLSLGEAQSGALGVGGTKVTIGDLAAHEIRVGLRWMLAPTPVSHGASPSPMRKG